MYPVLLKIGPLTIGMYGVSLAIGVLLAIFISLKLAKKENIDLTKMSDLVFFSLIIGLLVSKLHLLISNFSFYLKNPSQLKDILISGGTFYIGLISGILFAAWYIRKHKLNFKTISDAIVPGIALAHCFGRIGCFFGGCCWGRECHAPIGIVFSNPENTSGTPFNIPLFPVQLMEALLNFINFIILLFLYRRKKFPGQIFCIYLINYALIRFFTEYFRGDLDRGYIFGNIHHPWSSLSIPQLISIFLIIIAAILYYKFKPLNENPVKSQ